ncbi:hypothetical protein JYU34_021396 [Plutella xylostella]|uniref:FP protein C-terminal domain-containing protein n=1 Tax=Plutella xylostella TaxID=51655 RepID=A0ABQ7PTG6_PLUXY|nr:hypothetical protein JYU34_021396 [Plutella xylostella]
MDIYRSNVKNDSIGSIIVEISSKLQKDNFIRSVKNFNKGQSERLNTSHIKINGPIKQIFVSECLTKKGKRLFYMAREFAKENQYKFCWTLNGRVMLRKNEGAPMIRVDDEKDLTKLSQSKNN